MWFAKSIILLISMHYLTLAVTSDENYSSKRQQTKTAQLLPPVETDFKELIKSGSIFVDKSAWIRRVIEHEVHLMAIARPRGFGKSINLSMLRYFLDSVENSSKIFAGLEISKPEHQTFCQLHQNKYVVFYFDFDTSESSSYESIKPDILNRVKKVVTEQADKNRQVIGEKGFEDIQNMLQGRPKIKKLVSGFVAICRALRQAKKKFVILVDDGDAPFFHAFIKGETLTEGSGTFSYEEHQYRDTLSVMKSLFLSFFKDREVLPSLGITVGTTLVPTTFISTALNNTWKECSTMDDVFSSDFGFTDDEVQKLIIDVGSDMIMTNVRLWYRGYFLWESILYNPFSTLSALSHGKFKSYWCEADDDQLIGNLIEEGGFCIQLQMGLLIDGVIIEKTILRQIPYSERQKEEVAFWTFLAHAGYIDLNRTAKGLVPDNQYYVQIPNLEIKEYLRNNFVKTSPLKDSEYTKFLEGLLCPNKTQTNEFQKLLQNYVKKKSCFYKPSKMAKTDTFANYVIGILAGLWPTHRIVKVTSVLFSDIFVYGKDKKDSAIVLRAFSLEDEEKISASMGYFLDAHPKDPNLKYKVQPESDLRVMFPASDEIMMAIFDQKF